VGEASGVAEGIRLIQLLHPDLVFLDLNLQDGSGFDLLNAFTTLDFKVIFISSFSKEMIREFRLSDVDYLQKPVSPIELFAAVKNAEKKSQGDFVIQFNALNENIRNMGI
jgi:two-component system LytT family response regulator